MEAWVWVLIVVVAVVVILGIAMLLRSRRRRAGLEERFGPEYDRTVERAGDRKAAEADLVDRARERERLDIRPLSPTARDRYAEEWRAVQARFVDQPDAAVGDADRLVSQVMRERGYPVDDFEAQASLVSVDHPQVVEDYRAAHDIHRRNDERLADTDELRRALLHYRSLFDELLVTDGDGTRKTT